MKKDIIKKAVARGISWIFIFIARMPAICSQGGMIATVLYDYDDTSSNPLKNKKGLGK